MNKVKLVLLYIGFFSSLLLTGCKKLDSLTQFKMSYETDFTVQSSTVINLPINLVSPEIDSESETTFSNNNTSKDLIELIILEGLTIDLISPTDSDFSFLNSVEIYLNAEGLNEVLVAWNNNIESDPGNRLVLETSDQDIKDYIVQEEFSLKLKTVTDEVIDEDHQLTANSAFFVDAKILGQ